MSDIETKSKKHKIKATAIEKGEQAVKSRIKKAKAPKAIEGVKPEKSGLDLVEVPLPFMKEIDNSSKEINLADCLHPTEDSLPPETKDKEVKKELKELEIIETIEFKNGQNTLSLRFSKRHNRMFRIQIFLNEIYEIRSVTYTGSSTGYGFWNLLKATLKQ